MRTLLHTPSKTEAGEIARSPPVSRIHALLLGAGLVTAVIGTPYFLYLAIRARR